MQYLVQGPYLYVICRMHNTEYVSTLWHFNAWDLKLGGNCFLSCLSFCHSFCHSVLLSETLTLLITFELWVLELWYFTWVFFVIRPFRGYYFLPCDLGVLPIFRSHEWLRWPIAMGWCPSSCRLSSVVR